MLDSLDFFKNHYKTFYSVPRTDSEELVFLNSIFKSSKDKEIPFFEWAFRTGGTAFEYLIAAGERCKCGGLLYTTYEGSIIECINPKCADKAAYKVAKICKGLGIADVGPANGKVLTHFGIYDIFTLLRATDCVVSSLGQQLTNLELTRSSILENAGVKNFSAQADKLFAKHSTFKSIFEEYNKLTDFVFFYADSLDSKSITAETYFKARAIWEMRMDLLLLESDIESGTLPMKFKVSTKVIYFYISDPLNGYTKSKFSMKMNELGAAHGKDYKIQTGVNKDTKFLVMDSENNTGSRIEANKKKIPIIKASECLAMIEGGKL